MPGMATDINVLLQTLGFGTTALPVPTLYENHYPGAPDGLVATYDAFGGFAPVRTMGRLVMEVRNLQILVRHSTPSQAELLARRIFLKLDMMAWNTKRPGLINGIWYESILARTPPFSLGRDEKNRTQWTCNYVVHKTPTPPP
jgi:hypothetical protein